MVSSIVLDKIFLFDSYMGPYQELPLHLRVDQRVMVMREYSTFPKDSRL